MRPEVGSAEVPSVLVLKGGWGATGGWGACQMAKLPRGGCGSGQGRGST